MNLKKLLDEGRIEEVEKTKADFRWALDDLKVSKDNLDSENFEWALSICYNAVLRSGINLMNSFGYRARGREHHKNVFLFLKEIKGLDELSKYFDRVRRKRNGFIYRNNEEISEVEAREALDRAEEFVSKIRTVVQEIRTGDVKDE